MSLLRARSNALLPLDVDVELTLEFDRQGIGRAIASALAHLGANVVVAARKMDQLEAAVREIEKSLPAGHTNRVVPMQCNIRDEADVKRLFAETKRTFGGVGLLVNNAGGQFPSPCVPNTPF